MGRRHTIAYVAYVTMRGRELEIEACRGHRRNNCWGRREVVKGAYSPQEADSRQRE